MAAFTEYMQIGAALCISCISCAACCQIMSSSKHGSMATQGDISVECSIQPLQTASC